MKKYKSKSRKNHGFTLIELVIVITITAILAFGVIGLWPGTTITLTAQTALLANDIRYTQILAMSTGMRCYLAKTSSNSYRIYKIVNGSSTLVTMPSGSTTTTLNSGITFGTFSGLPNSLIAFDTKGTPYTDTGSPGSALGALATIYLNAGNQTPTSVTITQETGRVTP